MATAGLCRIRSWLLSHSGTNSATFKEPLQSARQRLVVWRLSFNTILVDVLSSSMGAICSLERREMRAESVGMTRISRRMLFEIS